MRASARDAQLVVSVPVDDRAGVWSFVEAEEDRPDVVGPEAPLVAGLADELRQRGFAVFGPNADGARLEGSKAFAKEVMNAAGVPTGRRGYFTDYESARGYLARRWARRS